VLGGSGYLRDFAIEQYIRDTKVDTLYEGTTAIQGLDLFFRKVVRDGGRAFASLLAEVEKILRGVEDDTLAAERALLATAVNELRAMAGWMGERAIAERRDTATMSFPDEAW
jgi:acyl-CoA dehydrogenase-like protein